MRFRHLLVFIVLFAAAACESTDSRQTVPAPDVEVFVRHRTGSSFRSSEEDLPPPAPEDFNSIVVSFHAFEKLPDNLLEPVTDHASLFLQSGEESVFMPAPRLTAGTRVGFGPDAERTVDTLAREGQFGGTIEIGRATGIVARGTTASINLRNRNPRRLPGLRKEVHEGIFVDLTETSEGKGYILSVGMKLIVEPEPALSAAGMNPGDEAPGTNEETASMVATYRLEAFVIDLAVSKTPHAIIVVLPAPFLDHDSVGVLAGILISSPPAAYTPARLEYERDVQEFDVEKEILQARKEKESLASPLVQSTWSGLSGALSALEAPETRRNALAYAARETGARLAEDVALSASDEAVAAVAARVIEAAGNLPRPAEAGQVGLLLEKCTYGLLIGYLAARDPPPAIVGIILRHTGEVGRHPTVLEEIVKDAKSLEGLRRSFIDENVILLEDSSPIARVRAYDWLTLTGVAPPDYDPLDSREKRREVMNRYLEGLAEKVGDR